MQNIKNTQREQKALNIAIACLLGMALLNYLLFYFTHFELWLHLTAVFIEIAVSVGLLELYIVKIKKENFTEVYCAARWEYLFARGLRPFNRAFTEFLENTDFLKEMGEFPSNHKSYQESKIFETIARSLVKKMDLKNMQTVAKAVRENYLFLENQFSLGTINVNEDLFNANMNFMTNCYKFMNFWENNSPEDLAQDPDFFETLVFTISWWLYIINNFIFYTKNTETDVKEELSKNIKLFQSQYRNNMAASSAENIKILDKAAAL